MNRDRFRKILLLQFAVFAVVVGLMGVAAFGLLLWDFQFPGTFLNAYPYRGGMPVNLVLLLAFGVQHSVMARKSFKAFWRRIFPVELIRSSYVLFSGFLLFLLVALWSPMTPPLYDFQDSVMGYLLNAGAGLGLVVMFLALAGTDSLDLIGLRSVWRILKGVGEQPDEFRKPWIYRIVRHPLYLGMLLVFWLTPAMTHDHLFFAEVMTAYILVGIQFEEIDLVAKYGLEYEKYQDEVPMIIPFLKIRRRNR